MTSTETRHDLTGTVVGRLAALAADIRTTGLPAELRKDVARRVLDLLGNSLAAHDQPSARVVTEVARNWSGAAAANGIGTRERFPAATAALVNGTLAHSMDSDDTHLPSVLHPSASVIPAALAVGEAVGASGAAVLDAAGVGIEIVVRLGMGGYDEELGNSEFFERGQHATTICGAVGSAAAAAMLYGLETEGIADAMGIAASFGAGLLEANRTGGTVKRTHCGWAAHSGVTSAEFARAGLTGPPTVIEGRFGFLHAFCGDRADTAKVLDGLGEHWELPGIFFKPYPCNHFTHAGIDAARALVRDGLDRPTSWRSNSAYRSRYYARSPSPRHRRLLPNPVTTRPSRARSPSHGHCSVARDSVWDTPISPTLPRRIRAHSNSRGWSRVTATTAATRSTHISSRRCSGYVRGTVPGTRLASTITGVVRRTRSPTTSSR